MTKVLVVDDEPRYREYLGRLLEEEGYAVHTAATGREAIDLGLRLRPDVLVVDWMLRGDLHGLHVAAALREARPDLRAILITGFPSRDLHRAAARSFSVLLEKPFELEAVLAAVEAALRSAPPASPARLGLLELGPGGEVRHASPRALALLGPGCKPGIRLRGGAGGPLDLDAAVVAWQEARADGPPVRLRAGHRAADGSRIAVVDVTAARPSPLIEIVLGVEEPLERRWPFAGRVLVVDDDDLVRRFSATLLEQVGATVYAAATHAEAHRLLENDPGIELVLLDFDMPDGDIARLIRPARQLCPDAVLVGNSGQDRSLEFAARGVPLFLEKPWRLSDLLALLGQSSLQQRAS